MNWRHLLEHFLPATVVNGDLAEREQVKAAVDEASLTLAQARQWALSVDLYRRGLERHRRRAGGAPGA